MAILEVSDLKKTYFKEGVETPALRGVSFEISDGEFVAIMGPSGSGKSTLLQILGFLDKQTGGSYKFGGKSMEDYSDEEIARIRNRKLGFVFQQFNLLQKSTILENTKLPLLYSDKKESSWDRLAKEAIIQVDLEHRINHEAYRLSGGEQQRAAIARALVNDPQVIFADEPTGNLDSKSGQIVMDILEKLNNDGHTVVLITHETNVAEHAKRIIHIKDGLVESDKQVKIRRNYFEK